MKRGALILLIIAVVFLLSGVVMMWRAYTSRQNWQFVDARVGDADVMKFRNYRGQEMYRGWVEFAFEVNGVTFNVPHSLPGVSVDYASARADVDRYPPKSTSRVYYNPADPNDTLLDIDSPAKFFLVPSIFAGIGVVMAGAWIVAFGKFDRFHCDGCAAPVTKYHRFCWSCGAKLPRRLRSSGPR